jgi:A/G-specific adenine glycosylase
MHNKMQRALLAWFDQNKRDLPWRGAAPDAYHVWVSEIMLQQTRVEAVKGYYLRFLRAFPTVRALAAADDDLLMKLWEGLGYYSRARNLKKAAQVVMREYDGRLPADPAQLLRLPGVGLYTAGAVASIAYGVAVPAVDGNVLRVWARLHADEADIALEQTKKALAARLLHKIPRERPGDFNQALMELGACVCVPGIPGCARCPLQAFCLAHAQGVTHLLPVKSKKKPRKIVPRQLLILRWDSKTALRRRPAKGLLAGLWELPEAQSIDLPEPLVLLREPAGQTVHVFTHLEWHMSAERVTLSAPPEAQDLVWVTKEEQQAFFALPSAFAGFADVMF